MRAALLPVGLCALIAAGLAWVPSASAQSEFDDEFADEFGDEFGDEEEPAPEPEPQQPAPEPADQGRGQQGQAEDEFEAEFDELEAREAEPPEAEAPAGEPAPEPEQAPAPSVEEAEPEEVPQDEPPEDEESVRARRFRAQNTVGGPVGGIRVVDAGSAAADSFRLQLATEFFFLNDFLFEGDNQDRIGGTLSASWTITDYIEVFASLRAFASNNSQGDPTLLQVLGDTTFGFKGFYQALPWLAVGGDFTVAFLNTVGDIGVVGRSTSFGLRANATADLRGLADPIPLITRLNLQYFFDNSEELIEDVENARFDNLEDPRAREDEFRHLVTREERFGLDINRTDFFNIGIGFEAPLRAAEDFYIHPIAELNWKIPVNRQDYSCLFIPPGAREAGDDSCLDQEEISAFPLDITLGFRVLPPVKGLSFLAAVDVGVTGTDPGDFVRELAPNTPYNVIVAGSYAYDTRPPPKPEPIVREKEVEVVKEIAPLRGRIEGLVVEQGAGTPVAEATVRFPEHDASPLLTGEDGRFLSYRFEPGEVPMELSHPEYEPGTCAGTIPEERPEGDEELIVEVKCELVALPRKGSVDGKVVSEAGDAVSGADIKLMGPETKNLTTGSDGSFEVADLTPGTYNARVEADGYLIKLHEFDVEARETAQPEVTLLEKPRRSLVRVRRRQIQIRRQINFATDSAEIEPSSFPLMHQIADVLMRNPQIERVEIQGHTDNRGSAQHNMDLSQSRAESVRQWLIDHGVEASRLEAKGYGQTRPLVPNITPANRARNRRVQFIIKERAAEEE